VRKTVLVVEDFDDIRDAMRILIEEIHGCRVIEATDGLEAIEKAKEHLPDLILMDIAMPVFDGLYATRQIKSDPQLRNIPVIAVTSFTSDFNKQAIEAGCDQVFEKPKLLSELDRLLSEIVPNEGHPDANY
jgi:two-component system cell cycle response regulator DivK